MRAAWIAWESRRRRGAGSWRRPRRRKTWTTRNLQTAGEDPERCVVEGIPDGGTRCSAVRDSARRNHEVLLHRPADQPTRYKSPVDPCDEIAPSWPFRPKGHPGTRSLTATLDSGSDDTLLPAYLATRLGIDLDQAPQGEAGTVGGAPVPYRYATVTLRLSDGSEECQWDAIVGFVAAPECNGDHLGGHASGLYNTSISSSWARDAEPSRPEHIVSGAPTSITDNLPHEAPLPGEWSYAASAARLSDCAIVGSRPGPSGMDFADRSTA